MDWLSSAWDTASSYATEAFSWMGDNPEATNLLGGIAVGAAQGYMMSKEGDKQRAFDKEMYERRRRDQMINPGELGNYGSHLNTIAGKGLLTSGMIAGQEQ